MLPGRPNPRLDLFYMEQKDLYQSEPRVKRISAFRAVKVFNDPQRWFELGSEQDVAPGELDVILMRKDPPFDNEFVYSTYLLEQAEQAGVGVNRPQSLRDCNEKYCSPPSSATAPTDRGQPPSRHSARVCQRRRDIILKPLDGMGGSMIFPSSRRRSQPFGDPRDPDQPRPAADHGSGLPAGDQGRRQAHPDDRRRTGALLPGAYSSGQAKPVATSPPAAVAKPGR